jgi:hypothetical protein
MKDDFRAPNRPLRSSWNPDHMLVLGPLTDRKIEKYAQRGWYSAEFRQARRERWQRKGKRDGNFVERDGRMIYSPV